MIVGYILLGTVFGLCAFIAARLLGLPLWPSLIVYSLAGMLGAILLPLLQLVSRRFVDRLRKAETDPLLTSAAADGGIDPLVSSPMKILAVDDDPYILELVPLISAKVGFSNVISASSGEDALDLLSNGRHQFDCLLLDISMPEMNGIELCRRARQLAEYRDTPIIMLTAMRDVKHLHLAFQAGATDFTAKPFDIGDLGKRLSVAQETISELRRRATPIRPIQPGKQAQPFDPPDAIGIEDVKDLVSATALANYLRQLPRSDLSNTQVCAVKMQDFESLADRMNREKVFNSLKTVGETIGMHVRPDAGLMAYCGAGVFLVVNRSNGLSSSIELEVAIQERLRDTNASNDDDALVDLQVSVGKPVLADARPISRTVERVIALAELRVLEKRNDATQTGRIRDLL